LTRLCFLNPFCTDQFDELIRETLTPYLRDGTELEIVHLEDSPRNIDYFVPKHLAEVEVLRSVVAAERAGFDAFVIGCCYDPGLKEARELAEMPVVGPLEAAVALARPFGHRFSVVTDHRKAVPELEDLLRVYGAAANCRSVRAIDWYVDDMVRDPDAVARDAFARCREVLDGDGAEAVVLGCTIVAACYERAILNGADDLAGVAILNPNVMAVKMAELLADLRAVGQYRVARSGYYGRHAGHDPDEAAEVLDRLMRERGA
jgi:allantoin racemase